MLTRASRGGNALRTVEQAAEQLQLPFLCPALDSSSPIRTQRRPTSTRRTLSQPNRVAVLRPQVRRLASAAPFTNDVENGDEYLPFSYERSTTPMFTSPASRAEFDVSNLLKFDHTTALPHERLSSHGNADIRGNSREVEATFEACLQMQRWDQAFTILKQLHRMYAMNPVRLQHTYDRVLEAMVFDSVWNQTTDNHTKINNWIEVHMRQAGLDPSAQTFALKIKAALATAQGLQRDRTVRRYWAMAKEYQLDNQVASLRNILSDSDLGKLSEICPSEVVMDYHGEARFDMQFEVTDEHLRQTEVDVRATAQKGLGLISLKKSLALFSEPTVGQMLRRQKGETEQEAIDRYRQTKLEEDSLKSALERWQIEHEQRSKMGFSTDWSSGKIGALMWQWHEAIADRIKAELQLVSEAEDEPKKTADQRNRCEYGPFLRLLEPQQIAALTAVSVMQIMSRAGITHHMKISRLVVEVGRILEDEVRSQRLKDQRTMERRAERLNTGEGAATATAGDAAAVLEQDDRHLLHTSGIRPTSARWSVAMHARVGAVLCEMMFDAAKISIEHHDLQSGETSLLAQPIFTKKYVFHNGRKFGTAVLHPRFQAMMTRQPAANLIAKQLPMVSKPKPWTDFARGGYLQANQPVLRVKFHDQAQVDYTKAAAERGDLDQVFKGLDVLGQTGWQINKNIFGVMLTAWNSGEAVANLPPLEKVFPDVQKPQEDATPMDKWKYVSRMRQIENERGGLHSNRCFQNFQMEIAKAYLDETFYLPHNLDFRGRAYPIPPYLNQMGADNARGLLLFAKGRELGSEGLAWLKVHLANVFGYDKASLSDRAQFAVDHLDDIHDSCNRPLAGRRWWLEAEDPWQCLATCYELQAALRLPDPSKYVSHLPIHQDGTCNGLQHYAALGGDVAGARQVNLEPGDKPADVYSGVAELVRSEIKHDAENGVDIAQKLQGRITRKIVKQTVMTNVYGVTFMGAIRQVRKQVESLMPELIETNQAGLAATYIAKKIFKGLGKLFEGAHEIQYWLGDCASRITRSISSAQLEQIAQREFGDAAGVEIGELLTPATARRHEGKPEPAQIDVADFRSTVVWTTPLQLPVVQPYRTNNTHTVQTNLQSIALLEPSIANGVDPRKQLQAFPPNFVHSLDATHMMLSALKAHEAGLSFSAVHDSFWTHAADVTALNGLLRDEFIRMHGEDIMGRLAAEFNARYRGHYYLAKVPLKSALGQKIAQYRKGLHSVRGKHKQGSTYTRTSGTRYKTQRYNELVRELKRSRLLASADPAERAEGEKMVTAMTIFEAMDGAKFLPAKVSLGQTALGEAPAVDPTAVEDALQADASNPDIDIEQALKPLIDADEEVEVDSPEPASTAAIGTPGKPKKITAARKEAKESTWLWLPLTFRDVPKRGEWDLQRLRDSVYFFS